MNDAASAGHREIGFEVCVVVPHEGGDPVASLQPQPLERAEVLLAQRAATLKPEEKEERDR